MTRDRGREREAERRRRGGKETDKKGVRERQTDRQREGDRDRKTERDRDRAERETDRDRETETVRNTETERQTVRESVPDCQSYKQLWPIRTSQMTFHAKGPRVAAMFGSQGKAAWQQSE